MVRGARVVGRILGGVVTGKRLVGIGTAWATAFCKAVVVDRGVPLWLSSPMESLVLDDDGRVVGVRVRRDGAEVRIDARRGVMLAGGGFEANTAWRKEYHGIEGAPSGNPGNLGHPIAVAQDAVSAPLYGRCVVGSLARRAARRAGPAFIVGEWSMPYSLMVDSRGEAVRQRVGVLRGPRPPDARERRRHRSLLAHHGCPVHPPLLPYLRDDPRAMKAMRAAGIVLESRTLGDLARAIGVEPAALLETVERFNGYARSGVDGEFGRGNSAYDRYYGDPTVHPNPNLGPLLKGTFTAYRVVLGDLGTKGGVVTDADGRALREDGSVIEGLYASGNTSASVMGRTYPGPGSTIAPAAVFGLRAARDMARQVR